MRIFPSSNEGFPTLDNSLSSIFANVSAACLHDSNPIVSYYLGAHQAALAVQLYFRSAPLHARPLSFSFKQNPSLVIRGPSGQAHTISKPLSDHLRRCIRPLKRSLVLALVLFPKTWGGFSVQLLGSLLSRGFPDPQSQDCALLRQIFHRAGPELRGWIINMLSPIFSVFKSPVLVAQDPTALNLMMPSSTNDTVKRRITAMLKEADWIVSPKIQEFLHLSTEGLDFLCEYLVQMRPCNTRVIHEIVEVTLFGRALQHRIRSAFFLSTWNSQFFCMIICEEGSTTTC